MKISGWLYLPAAFFLSLNFLVSPVKILFLSRLAYFLLLVFLFLLLRRVNPGKILPPVIGGISIILFAYGILQKFVLFPIYLRNLGPGGGEFSQKLLARIRSDRIFSLFSLPTLYAIVCAVLILFLLHYLVTADTTKKRIGWALLLGAGLFNLVLTQSFGGVLYLTAGVTAYLLLAGILKFKYLAPVIMVLALFIFITAGLRFSETRRLEPVKLRLSNWQQATRIIGHHPFWGTGLGNYEARIAAHTMPGEAKSIYAHNFFLQFTAETGLLFPLFLLMLLASAGKKLIPRNPGEKTIEICVFLALILYNAVDIGFYFFPVGIVGVYVLSRIYPAPQPAPLSKPRSRRGTWWRPAMVVLLALLPAVETVSDGYRREGDLLLGWRNYMEAEKKYKKSLDINPYNYKTMIRCASLYHYHTANTASAESLLRRALEIFPNSPFGHFLMSQVQLKRSHLFGAYTHAAAARDANPRNPLYRKHWNDMIRLIEKTWPPPPPPEKQE